MPRDLPGMYWDAERNRYFPIASSSGGSMAHRQSMHTQSPQHTAPASSNSSPHSGPYTPQYTPFMRVLEPNPHRGPSSWSSSHHYPQPEPVDVLDVDEEDGPPALRKRRKHDPTNSSAWQSISRMRTVTKFSDFSRLNHDLLCTSIISTSYSPSDDVETSSYNWLSSFAVKEQPQGGYSALVGDQTGWLYSYNTQSPHLSTRELFLGADVLSVCLSENFRIAVPFGPSCEFAIQILAPRDVDVWSISRIMNKSCYDVRAAHLLDNSLLLGAAGRGILLPDITAINSANFQFLNTGSDVLTVHQRDRFAYAGCRNGSIFCFDKRLDARSTKGQELFAETFTRSNNSITHLSVVREWELLVSTIRGDLQMFDVRFARNNTPIMQFEGHVNSYRQKLGIATSPCQTLLFAAGGDHRVRAWSLLTGQPLSLPSTSSATQSTSSSGFSPTPSSSSAFPPFPFNPYSPTRTYLPTPQHPQPGNDRLLHPVLFQDSFPGDVMELQVTGGLGGTNLSPEAQMTSMFPSASAQYGGGGNRNRAADLENLRELDRRKQSARENELCLWVASGCTVYRYWLGRKGMMVDDA